MDKRAYRAAAYKKAIEYASRTSPPPQWSPWYAGGIVAFGAAFVCSTFAGIAGVGFDSPAFAQGQTLTSLGIGAAVFFVLRRQEKNHEAAISRRYHELLSEVGDDGSPLNKNTGQRPSA